MIKFTHEKDLTLALCGETPYFLGKVKKIFISKEKGNPEIDLMYENPEELNENINQLETLTKDTNSRANKMSIDSFCLPGVITVYSIQFPKSYHVWVEA